MSWFITAKLNKKLQNINKQLKGIIKENPFFVHLFNLYSVPMEQLKDLTFVIEKMRGKFAYSDSKKIYLNENLFKNNDLINDKIHFVVHELIHWLTRQREKDSYFSDPEEVQAFIYSICWEIQNGKDKIAIKNIFFPIIDSHFEDIHFSNNLFEILFDKAYKIQKNINQA